MSSSDDAAATATEEAATATEEEATEPVEVDELRESLLGRVRESLGDAVVGSHIRAGDDLWIRVTREVWREAGKVLRDKLGCSYFTFLSALDWLPSPYGRSMDAEVDKELDGEGDADREEVVAEPGYAGGETRFQVFARVACIGGPDGYFGVTLKADLPDDDLRIDTWSPLYAGANWHERETWEMFGITFEGHPYLRHIYLPSGFEGHPLRKDYPLLARTVKPWPGIVDVEPMPGEDDDGEDEGG